MLFNLRAVISSDNGTTSTLTWHKIECVDEQDAHAKALQYAKYAESQFTRRNTKSIEIFLPSDEQLDEEAHEHAREKAEFELFCGGYED